MKKDPPEKILDQRFKRSEGINSGDVCGRASKAEVLTRRGTPRVQNEVGLWWRGGDEKVREMTRGQVLETKLCTHNHPADDKFYVSWSAMNRAFE